MITLFTILHYFFAAVVDGLDKVLISQRKILPLSYAFWSVVTGLGVIIGWPWVYESLALGSVGLDLAAGALFSLTLYVFFKAVSQGEISRVVPFIFGLAPVFDVLIGLATGRNPLGTSEVAAIFLLVPGALLISYRKGFWGKHVVLKLFSAFSLRPNKAVKARGFLEFASGFMPEAFAKLSMTFCADFVLMSVSSSVSTKSISLSFSFLERTEKRAWARIFLEIFLL